MAEDIALMNKQLVVFNLGEETYGVDIATVREIIQMQPITRVPGAARFIEGVINLRGAVIPVVDMRRRFGLETTERDDETRIVVVSSRGQDVGMVVDSVAEVLRVEEKSIEPPSSMLTGCDTDYVMGISKLPDRLVILLDVDRMLSREDRVISATASAKEVGGGEGLTEA